MDAAAGGECQQQAAVACPDGDWMTQTTKAVPSYVYALCSLSLAAFNCKATCMFATHRPVQQAVPGLMMLDELGLDISPGRWWCPVLHHDMHLWSGFVLCRY
jgi:hypothetical protein